MVRRSGASDPEATQKAGALGPAGTGTGTGTGTKDHTCDDGAVSDQPQIDFFAFKARKFCLWFEKVSQSDHLDGIRAIHVVSGLVASAAKLMRIRIAGRPHGSDGGAPTRPSPSVDAADFPVRCRSDWAAVCSHRSRTGGLPGCLAEVHRELVRGLDILDSGRPYDAISHWQLGYVHNWGELAICALMMLHSDLANTRSS